MTAGKIPLGEAIVDDEGTWRLEVPRTFFPDDGGVIEVEFEYASDSYPVSGGLSVESPDEGISFMMIAIIGIIILTILGVLAFFFIEFEDEEDDYDDLMAAENCLLYTSPSPRDS